MDKVDTKDANSKVYFPLALRYIELPLYTEANLIKHLEV